MGGTSSISNLAGLYPALVELGQALGLSTDVLSTGETSQRLFSEREIESPQLAGISIEPFERAVLSWGDSLTVRIESKYGVHPFSVERSQIDSVSFQQFGEDIRRSGSGETVTVRLAIDKRTLASQLASSSAKTNLAISIFSANLEHLFSGKFPEIQEALFPNIQDRCVCLVLDNDIEIRGPFLSVVGPTECEAELTRRAKLQSRSRIENAWYARETQVSWIDFQTQLTPYHFVSWTDSEARSQIRASLTRLQYALGIAYLADSVRQVKDGYVATFSGLGRSEIFVPRQPQETPQNVQTLARIFIWAYSDKTADKLPFVRSVASSFLSEDREKNYRVLGEQISRIWESTRASYVSYVHGIVARHFEKLREVEEYVRETSGEVAQQISEIVKGLVTNMLATIGVMVGGFITYGVDKKTSPRLLAIGLFVYAGYVAFFPLFYSLIFHNLVDYLITVRQFTRRVREFELVLHVPGLLQKMEGSLTPRKVHFWAAFTFSCVVYLALGFLCYRLSHYFSTLPT